jgi:hypothetical protein
MSILKLKSLRKKQDNVYELILHSGILDENNPNFVIVTMKWESMWKSRTSIHDVDSIKNYKSHM